MRRQAHPCAPLVPGLVIFKTSDTPDLETIEIDQVACRLKRMRRSVTVAARLFSHVIGRRQFKPAMVTLTYRDVDGFGRSTSPRSSSAFATGSHDAATRCATSGSPSFSYEAPCTTTCSCGCLAA